jgi:hypothetical protein
MPEQTPAPPAPPAPAAPAAPAQPASGAPSTAPEKQPPWGKPENFNPDKAWELIQNLRSEKGGDPSLKTELEQLRQQQQSQRDALAAALGVKPEETSDSDKLAQQIESLRGQILTSEKRALSVEFKVPEHMLTASDADGLRKQASDLAEFAKAAHYAAVTNQPAPPPPAFQPHPGQGQGGGPMTPEAQAAAEYEKYYPSSK